MRQDTWKTYLLHIGLFLLTLITTTLAGAEQATAKILIGWGMVPKEALVQPHEWVKGLPFALSFLAFLTFHEFGHYFMSLYRRVKCSLPYYIPIFIPLPTAINIGSFGAVIRLRQRPDSTTKYFDIGIAGPLAGFVVSIGLLLYGFTHLPDINSYVLQLHPEYLEDFGGVPSEAQMQDFLRQEGGQSLVIGSNLLFDWLKNSLPADPSQVPTRFELMHYPFLFVGYLTLFFTALNLLPIGQLDGGHIIYGMFGARTSGFIARLAVVGLIFIGGTGAIDWRALAMQDVWYNFALRSFVYLLFLHFLYRRLFHGAQVYFPIVLALLTFGIQILLKQRFPALQMNLIWLLYAFLAVRFVGVDHPPAFKEEKIGWVRMALGWLAIAIFILCFSPEPLKVVG